jgi:hypothetical protein
MRRPFWSWFRSRWNWNCGIKDSASALGSLAGLDSVAMLGNEGSEESSELQKRGAVLPLQLGYVSF